jgi:hypothetical protein
MKRENDTLLWGSEEQHRQFESALHAHCGYEDFFRQLFEGYHKARQDAVDWWREIEQFCEPGETAHYSWSQRQVVFRETLDTGKAEVEQLRGDLQEMAAIIGCLEPAENGAPCCDPPCLACRYAAKREET